MSGLNGMPSQQMPQRPSLLSRNKILNKYRHRMQRPLANVLRSQVDTPTQGDFKEPTFPQQKHQLSFGLWNHSLVSSNVPSESFNDNHQSEILSPSDFHEESIKSEMLQSSSSVTPPQTSNNTTLAPQNEALNTSCDVTKVYLFDKPKEELSDSRQKNKDSKTTRIGRRLIEDFLLPALNEEKYGDLLKWIDRDKRYFVIRWSHKNAAKWSLDDTVVFQDWDKLKGHYHPEIKGYYMQAKQRFRAALYKLNSVRKLPCEEKHVKKYQLILNHERRHHEAVARKPQWSVFKEQDQKSIPTPVICRNTAFIAKPQKPYAESSYSSSSSPPSSPASSIKSEELECVEEYALAQTKQIMQNNSFEHSNEMNLENVENINCMLEENSEMNLSCKTRHVPIQPVPLYSKCAARQTLPNSHKRVESPHVLLVKTYNDSDNDERTDNPGIKKVKVEKGISHCNGNTAKNLEYSDCALNLSTKCVDMETLSR